MDYDTREEMTTKLTKMNRDSIERRLALASCRGDKQFMIVNEMLVGPVVTHSYPYGTHSYPYGGARGQMWITVGSCKIGWTSFRALRKRLVMLGFIFEVEKVPQKSVGLSSSEIITMRFPEGENL